MKTRFSRSLLVALVSATSLISVIGRAEEWPQLLGDALRSGNAVHVDLETSIGLVAAIPLTDAIVAAPVVSGGKVFVMDGAGVVFAIDTATLEVIWRFKTRGGPGNCNNVAAPAVAGEFVHIGTTAGYYYVLDQETGKLVKEIDCREPVFSVPTGFTSRRSVPRCTRWNSTARSPGLGTSSRK